MRESPLLSVHGEACIDKLPVRRMQAPPQAPKVKTEGVEAVPLNDRVTMLRGVCNERLKFEIEYGLRRGTTDNSYIVKVQCSSGNMRDNTMRMQLEQVPHTCCARMQAGKEVILVDVPDEAFTDEYGAHHALILVLSVHYPNQLVTNPSLHAGAVARLEQTVALQSVTALVLTHLTPKRMPSLKALLQLLSGRGGAPRLDIHLSNPALQLLRSSLGASSQPLWGCTASGKPGVERQQTQFCPLRILALVCSTCILVVSSSRRLM